MDFKYDPNAFMNSNTGTTSNGVGSPEQLVAGLKRMMIDIENFPHNRIKIWKGSTIFPAPFITKKDIPTLEYCPFVDDIAFYIVAGIGIVAGKKAFKILSQLNIHFEWSDTHIPLEEQDSDVVRLIQKWENNKFADILLQSIEDGG